MSFVKYLIHSALISLYNSYLYKIRHKGTYKKFFKYYAGFNYSEKGIIKSKKQKLLSDFLEFSTNNSTYFKKYRGLTLQDFPIQEKQDLVNNYDNLKTISENKGTVSYTGGTTGTSTKVVYTQNDMQHRFAILDSFRFEHGYKLGEKTAWFSGKKLVSPMDVSSGKCYRDDFINRIRFYSTFHISLKNFEHYWSALEKQSPKFVIGFPSSVYELCRIAKSKNLVISSSVKAFFPTAETVLNEHREIIPQILGCKIIDQYASSEGAPFILECNKGTLHINELTGVFEVVDENMNPSQEGEILVTSFTTHGTPLIRYRIGDRIKLASKDYVCPCGSVMPSVEYIDGRTNDFIWSEENGRVNLGNISNCTKNIHGILSFQVIQNQLDRLEVNIIAGNNFNNDEKNKFIKHLTDRVGNNMQIKLCIVEEIQKEKSGKFRLVKNNVHNLINE